MAMATRLQALEAQCKAVQEKCSTARVVLRKADEIYNTGKLLGGLAAKKAERTAQSMVNVAQRTLEDARVILEDMGALKLQ